MTSYILTILTIITLLTLTVRNYIMCVYYQAQLNKKKRITAFDYHMQLVRSYRASRNRYPFHQ